MQKQATKDAHKRHQEDEARTEDGSKKGHGKVKCECKANTTWQGDTQQGVGPEWVDTSGSDEWWTGWGGTKGGGPKGKGGKGKSSPWGDANEPTQDAR